MQLSARVPRFSSRPLSKSSVGLLIQHGLVIPISEGGQFYKLAVMQNKRHILCVHEQVEGGNAISGGA